MHEVVKFHKNIFEISLFNLQEIRKAYKDVLGLKHIVHLSVNIVEPSNEIMFISATPNTGINVCGSNLWQYDKSISPAMYKNNSFYFWDSCYQKKAFLDLKIAKEMENGILCGFVVIEKINQHYVMYSYGLDNDGKEMREQIESMQDHFLEMGRHCFEKVYPIYDRYKASASMLDLTHVR